MLFYDTKILRYEYYSKNELIFVSSLLSASFVREKITKKFLVKIIKQKLVCQISCIFK